MEAIIFIALAATINKLFSVVKAVKVRDWNVPISHVSLVIIGTLVLGLAANSSITEAYALPGFTEPLGDLDLGSIVLLSLLCSNTGAFAYDIKKALDGSDSAHEPSLLGGPHPPA